MAIRQEEFQIWRRANLKIGQNTIVYLGKDTEFFMQNPLHSTQGGCDQLKIEKIDDIEESGGLWEMVFTSNSIDKTRAKYKELLQKIGQEYLRVEKKIPKDILITPYE